jgi:hypothetical protein
LCASGTAACVVRKHILDPILVREHIDSGSAGGPESAVFYQSLKSKVGLAAVKAAPLRINLNTEGCGVVAPPMHARSRAPLLLRLLLSHNLASPRVH